ncbi:MAG: insulinase family protein [Deltaproteobacteria bacterium]|nr:MAG: insulinase family protein [Deltaproteobacteria bacterium]TNF24856.1 MAG: insulinase family protein [Deltaproteobacteria bacterium]
MKHHQTTLANGLQTLFIDSPGYTSGSVQIWFRAGSALEEKDNQGIAHFLEHMFFKGTQKRPGAAIAHEVESFGGELNAFTSFDYTCYYINTPKTYLNDSVEILLDMVSNPMFLQEDLEPERDVVFEEYRRSIDTPGQFAFNKLQKAAFSGTYSHMILGNEKTIKNFSRDQLVDFRNKFYNLSNALLVVSGDLNNKDQLQKTIENYKLPVGPSSSFPKFSLKKKSSIEVHQKDVVMAQLSMAIQAPNIKDKNAIPEDLAFTCLGHGESSILYKSLVLENTLANSCGSSTMFMVDGGVHFLKANFPLENMGKVLNKLMEVFKSATKNGFDKDEIHKIKNQYVASKIYEMESIESFAFSLGHSYAQNGDISAEEEFIDQARKTSSSSVNVALRKIFSKNVHMSLQIPKAANLKEAKDQLQKFSTGLDKLRESLEEKTAKALNAKTLKEDPQVKLIKVKKGVSLLYRQNTMNPTFSLQAYIKGGLTEETKQSAGRHHLICNLLTKGYGKRDYNSIKTELDTLTSSLSGFSGKNAYGLMMHGLTENMSKLAPMFVGAMMNPDFPAKFVKHEKEIALRAIDNQREDPIRICFQKVSDIFFNGHPYALNMIGNVDSVKKTSRKTLIDLHNDNLAKKEILLTYCGDLDLEEVMNHIKPIFDELKPRAEKKVVKKKYKPLTGAQEYIHFDREQTQIFHGVPIGAMGDKENLVLKMITTHLSGQSSELFVEVRDRQGLCYTAQPVHFMALEGGYWGIYMASGYDKVTRAIEAINGIINNIAENGISKSEFLRIKKMIEGQNLVNIQTNEDYAGLYSVPALQGFGLDYFYKSNNLIKKMTYEDFLKGIRKVFKKKWSTVVVGRSEVE